MFLAKVNPNLFYKDVPTISPTIDVSFKAPLQMILSSHCPHGENS
jgi:hypothetical protein